jgi:hypothetical protein
MRANFAVGMLAVVAALAGCGGSDKPEEDEPMKVEDTAFGPLVGTQDKARERANAAVEVHRENLDDRLEQDEGNTRKEEPPRD